MAVTGSQVAVLDHRGQAKGNSSATLVPWWSFTKTLIAACALRLAEQGRLALDVPLGGQPYTTRQLLQHCAGVGNYGDSADYHAAVARRDPPWSDDELFARFPPERLLFAPGTGWAYSNIGYLLLRRHIERISGTGLKDALNELLLAPLGLHSSRLAESPADMATTAFEGGHGYHPGWAFHGVVIGPVLEAAQALHGILQSDLLAPASRAALLDRHPIGGPIAGRPWQTTGYGLGLMIGSMSLPGMPQPFPVAGHSAGGPGSVGAVYQGSLDGRHRTVAVFSAGTDEGIAENEAFRLLTDRA
jgi:CubicO group peptidase (beta-lactamase class C family)